eukprot:UN02596
MVLKVQYVVVNRRLQRSFLVLQFLYHRFLQFQYLLQSNLPVPHPHLTLLLQFRLHFLLGWSLLMFLLLFLHRPQLVLHWLDLQCHPNRYHYLFLLLFIFFLLLFFRFWSFRYKSN